MKPIQLICQNCKMQYKTIKEFKAHVRSYEHKQEVAKMFGTALHKGPVYFPGFAFPDYLKDSNKTHPLIGFDLVTMFITPERFGDFYLCHVCEERLSNKDVVFHLCSFDHYFAYLAYTNPELLRFAWLDESHSYLKSSATKEYTTNGPGNLRVFELPKMMLASCKNMLYHQVMLTSSSNNLTERFQTGIPQRKTIQEYITDPARINPLLGMNLVLEYSCPTNEGYCAYLCVLCRKRLSANQIISHCISFDHIYWYLKAAHPGTLHSPKDKYSHYYSFHKEVLNVAKQAQTLCPPKEIQSISLDLEGYKVVNSSSYASALEKLQKIRRDRNESELSVNITAGERIMLAPEKRESSVRTTTRDISAQQPEKKREIEAPITKPNASPPCRILCVECDKSVNSLKEYKKHIKEMQHRQRLIELFGPGQYSDVLSDFKLYADMRKRGPLSPPLIGLPLLTVFVQRHTMAVNTAFYLCHACEIYVHGSSTSLHFASEQHCLNVLLYSKPDLVFLKSSNWSQIALEEQSKENHEPVLKVCELPRKRFKELRTLVYDKFIERIETNFTALRECFQAEKRVTLQSYSKCSERKSPLLGLQFMVKFTTTQPYNKCGFLCLLCEKRLPERQTIDHVLSFAHIYTYLDLVHPGSLCKEDSGLVSLISDLAHQAEKITSHTTLREVDVSFEMFNNIERNSFTYVVNVLQEVFQEKGLGELKPSIVPGERLVSSFKMNNENTSTTCEKQKHSPTDSEMQNVDGTCIVTMQNSEEQIESEYHDLVHAEDENLLETTSITSPHIQTNEKILETSQSNVNSSEPQSPSLHKEQPESLKLDQKTLNQEGLPDHHSTGNAETVKLPQSQDSNVPQQQSTELAQKPAIKMEAPQKPAQSPDFLSLTVHQTHLSTCSELRRFLETPNREPVIGLKTVIECSTVGQQPFYMCITCVERCEESLIVEHILSHQHRLQFLTSIEVCGIEPGKKVTLKWLKAQADMIEKKQGCGEAKTLNLDAEDYHEIFTAPIETALENLRLAILKLASEIGTQNTDAESDMGHEYKTSTITRETEENEGPHAHVKIPEPDLQPETSLKNSTDPVQSSPYLWSFLISPTRTEPVIGLSMVTEYRSSSGLNSFLCSCCKMILNTNCYVDHLISSDHRFNYIKSVDPEFVVHCQDEHKNSELQKKAQILQDSEGWGCLKVVEKENKQPQKTQPLLSDAETKPKIQNQEPTQASSDTDAESQNLKSNESKSTTLQNKTKINNAETEPQDYNRHEPKQQVKKKINKQRVAIGLNFVTCVTHNKKKLFFCELCSVRGHLDHMSSESHRKAYVEYKYGYTVRGTNMEKKLYKIALGLAKVEKSTGVGMKKLTVTAKVFAALRAAPLSEALNHLKLLQTKPEEALKTTLLPALGIITEHGSAVTTSCLQHDYSSFYDVHAPACASKPISPSPSLLCSTVSSSLPSPSLLHISRPVLSQPESPAQCVLVPHPLNEPISPPLASYCKDVPKVARPYSYPPFAYEPISPPPASAITGPAQHATSQCVSTAYVQSRRASGLECSHFAYPCSAICTHFTCSQSVFREENKHLHDTTVSKIYCLPKLPTVMGQSNASIFLNVKGLSTTEPIIGLSNIVECRGILHPTFFLCLSCAEKVSKEKFCDHMTSERHQFLSIKTQYPVEFQQWQGQMNHQITTRYFAEKLALTERGLDAKVIKLNQSQYELLSSAEFHDAIEILQRLFGPCVDDSTQLLHPAGQNQKRNGTSTVRSLPEFAEAQKEIANQSHQSCEKTPQIQEVQSSHAPLKESATEGSLPIKDEKTDYDEVQGNVPNVTPTLEAKKSEEHAGNSHTQTDLKSISKHRTEADALVGLSAVIECRVKGQALLYLCMSCSSKLDPHLINYHLVKPGHRYSYLKRRYPDMFENWSESDSRPDKSMKLMQFSQQVEMNNEDEPGQPQVITLKHDDLKEIKAMPYNKAIIHLQKIRKEQNLRSFKTCISPKIRKRLIKQERMETITTQCSQEQLVLHGSRRASKRRAVDQDLPLLSVRAKKQCSSNDFEQSPQIIVNNLDSVAQFQQESSYCTPATNVLDPVSQSYKSATSLHTTVLKNSLEQESSVTEPQQKDISSNTSTISALSNTSTISALSSETGQEIARLTEKRPLLKNSLSENAWHYEIREFSPETPSMTNANPVAEDSTESLALKHQSTAYSYNEPFSYNSLVSSFGKETSVTSQVTPEYALAYQYPMYKHPDYPSVIADSNSVASDYLVPIETAINYESAAAGISTNDADLMAANSAHTLPTVYVGVPVYPQVYQPIQSPQNQETFQPYYACGSYQQTPLTSTTAEENVISTPALEHGVYPLASWPQMKK